MSNYILNTNAAYLETPHVIFSLNLGLNTMLRYGRRTGV